MKFRTDFVTNSSSSSFVVVGYRLPKEGRSRVDLLRSLFAEKVKELEEQCVDDEEQFEDEIMDMWYGGGPDHSLFFADHPESGAPDGTYLIGSLIAEFDGESIPPSAGYTMEDLNKKAENVKLAFDLENEPMVYIGTRLC